MKVLVCGGRQYTDRKKLNETLDTLHDLLTFTQLAHGGASGADYLAGDWAVMRLGHDNSLVYPADWLHHGNGAGPRRNKRMLDHFKPRLVIAFPGTNGTADMVRRARSAKVPVIEVK